MCWPSHHYEGIAVVSRFILYQNIFYLFYSCFILVFDDLIMGRHDEICVHPKLARQGPLCGHSVLWLLYWRDLSSTAGCQDSHGNILLFSLGRMYSVRLFFVVCRRTALKPSKYLHLQQIWSLSLYIQWHYLELSPFDLFSWTIWTFAVVRL